MNTLIRTGAYTYDLVVDERVIEVTKFSGLGDIMVHLVIRKEGWA